MNKQNTEQLKKMEEIKKAVLDIVYTHLKVTGVKEVENQTYEEYICKGDLVQDLCDYITKTTPHLISSDEIKREAVKKYIKWDYNSSKDLGDSYNAPEITEEQLNAYYADFEKYLTQSKEGGDK